MLRELCRLEGRLADIFTVVQGNGKVPLALDVRMIRLDLLDDPFLPQRSQFKDEEFSRLVESIGANGVEVPLKVRPIGDRFQVVAGHRRKRASEVCGLREVPCIVQELTDLEALCKMIAENTGREEPSDAEQGRHYLEIGERFHLTEEQIAGVVKKTVFYVSERMDLVRRFPELSEANENALISFSVANELARVNDYTAARELRCDVALLTDVQREQIRKHRLMLLGLCEQQGATIKLAKSYVEQWKRSLLPMNAYDPNAGAPASAPQNVVAGDKCMCCGNDTDQNALVILKVHSWEKAAVKNVLRAAGMFGYD
jgi:ParB/RepB/Spo0J family partition protein